MSIASPIPIPEKYQDLPPRARPGYDWASGWGSLKIPALAKLAASSY